MFNIFNTDYLQLRSNTKYPFTDASTLRIGNYNIEATWIKQLHLNVSSAFFPLHINSIQKTEGAIILRVFDSKDMQIAYTKLKAQNLQSLFYSGNQICGSISIDIKMFQLLNIITLNGNKVIPSNIMQISPHCISCVHTIGTKYIKNGQTILYGDNQLLLDTNIIYNKPRLDIYGRLDVQDQTLKPLRYVKLVNIDNEQIQQTDYKDLSNLNLVIKHNILSNARVVSQGSKIILNNILDI